MDSGYACLLQEGGVNLKLLRQDGGCLHSACRGSILL